MKNTPELVQCTWLGWDLEKSWVIVAMKRKGRVASALQKDQTCVCKCVTVIMNIKSKVMNRCYRNSDEGELIVGIRIKIME